MVADAEDAVFGDGTGRPCGVTGHFEPVMRVVMGDLARIDQRDQHTIRRVVTIKDFGRAMNGRESGTRGPR